MVRRDSNGRYIVNILFTEDVPELDDLRGMAEKLRETKTWEFAGITHMYSL